MVSIGSAHQLCIAQGTFFMETKSKCERAHQEWAGTRFAGSGPGNGSATDFT
jgi:hypothetical protein